MKLKKYVLQLSFIFLTISFGQNKYDKVFINESKILIGEIKVENSETIQFFDVELGANVTLFKCNINKIITKDEKVLTFNHSNVDNKLNITTFDNQNKESNYDYGFYHLDFLTEDIDHMAKYVVEDFESWSSKYLVVRILGRNPEFYWFQIEPSDLSTKYILMRLPSNQYTIELFIWLTKTDVSSLITNYLREKNPPQLSERIAVEPKSTTYHRVVCKIRNDSNILFTKWAMEYETREKHTSFIEKNYLNFKEIPENENKIFNDALYSGTE